MGSYPPMIKIFRILVCISFTSTQAFSQNLPAVPDTAIIRLGETLLREKQGVGLSVGIIHAGQASFYNFGVTEKDGNEMPSRQSLYEIGSITKTFVGLLLAKAVNTGKARFDDDVRKYLGRSYPDLAYSGHAIQLLHLANMTSGLPDNLAPPVKPMAAGGDPNDSNTEKMVRTYTTEDFLDALAKVKPDTIPGTKVRHSNAGAQLLCYVVEQIYHQPIQDLVEQLITKPLDMKQTFFAFNSGAVTVKGYDGKGDYAPSFKNIYYKGAGGMISCTSDMVKYLSLLMKKDDPDIKTVLRKTILMDAGTDKLLGVYPDDKIDPTKYGASLNWYQYHPEKGKMRIWTDGGTLGFASYIVIYPEADLGIILLSNKTGESVFRSLPGMAGNILKRYVR
jgi:D-alanyl-D-alanine-carboxypeptidase/D-alanyl-D-alanine-endopeptidase